MANDEEEDCGLPSQILIQKSCSASLQDIQEGIECVSAELSECKEQLIPAVIEGGTCLPEITPFSERMNDFTQQGEQPFGTLR